MKKRNQHNRKFPLLLVASIAVFLSFMLSFFMGQNGLLRLRQLNAEYEKQRMDNFQVAMENRKMLEEVRRLRSDPATIEKIAREELRLVAPQDVVLIVPQ